MSNLSPDEIRKQIEETRERMSDRIESIRSSVTDSIGTMRDRVPVGRIRENPLGIFFGAAAVGFLLGSLLPRTDIENERLGEIGDRLKQRARTTGGQIITQGKAVVMETIEAAKA